MSVTTPVVTTHMPTQLRMSYEEFLQWSDEDKHAEWSNGEVIEFMTPPRTPSNTECLSHRLVTLFCQGI